MPTGRGWRDPGGAHRCQAVPPDDFEEDGATGMRGPAEESRRRLWLRICRVAKSIVRCSRRMDGPRSRWADRPSKGGGGFGRSSDQGSGEHDRSADYLWGWQGEKTSFRALRPVLRDQTMTRDRHSIHRERSKELSPVASALATPAGRKESMGSARGFKNVRAL